MWAHPNMSQASNHTAIAVCLHSQVLEMAGTGGGLFNSLILLPHFAELPHAEIANDV